ncbi:hypothetical protein HK102_011603, partial [Quaeritorhiza haematococci]
DLLIDLFSAPSGPRLRDRVSHGEANEIPDTPPQSPCSLSRVYLTLLIFLFARFTPSRIESDAPPKIAATTSHITPAIQTPPLPSPSDSPFAPSSLVNSCIAFVQLYVPRFHPFMETRRWCVRAHVALVECAWAIQWAMEVRDKVERVYAEGESEEGWRNGSQDGEGWDRKALGLETEDGGNELLGNQEETVSSGLVDDGFDANYVAVFGRALEDSDSRSWSGSGNVVHDLMRILDDLESKFTSFVPLMAFNSKDTILGGDITDGGPNSRNIATDTDYDIPSMFSEYLFRATLDSDLPSNSNTRSAEVKGRRQPLHDGAFEDPRHVHGGGTQHVLDSDCLRFTIESAHERLPCPRFGRLPSPPFQHSRSPSNTSTNPNMDVWDVGCDTLGVHSRTSSMYHATTPPLARTLQALTRISRTCVDKCLYSGILRIASEVLNEAEVALGKGRQGSLNREGSSDDEDVEKGLDPQSSPPAEGRSGTIMSYRKRVLLRRLPGLIAAVGTNVQAILFVVEFFLRVCLDCIEKTMHQGERLDAFEETKGYDDKNEKTGNLNPELEDRKSPTNGKDRRKRTKRDTTWFLQRLQVLADRIASQVVDRPPAGNLVRELEVFVEGSVGKMEVPAVS